MLSMIGHLKFRPGLATLRNLPSRWTTAAVCWLTMKKELNSSSASMPRTTKPVTYTAVIESAARTIKALGDNASIVHLGDRILVLGLEWPLQLIVSDRHFARHHLLLANSPAKSVNRVQTV